MKNEDGSTWGSNLDDFSFSATVIPFDPPLSLLRGPVPAGPSDDPSSGPFILAFPDAKSWRSAFQAAGSKIIEQCESGARVGCSIIASSKCKPPWWKSLFGVSLEDFTERERCEEREMSSCLAASKEACVQFAKEKSLPPFRDARIALVDLKGVSDFIFRASETPENVPQTENVEPKLVDLDHDTLFSLSGSNAGVTNYRGSALLEKSSIENTFAPGS